MTYPPPPGQPGADGWQGGNDPNQMPPNDPYNQGMPGYPPPGDPYGQQPTSGAGHYGQQQYDLYGQQPASGAPDPYGQPPGGAPDPYGHPASGVPGTNPYSAPPAFGPPQSQHPPQPDSNNNTAWIVGGVIGVVVILLAVVSVLFITGTFDSNPDDKPTAADGGDESKDPEGEPTGPKENASLEKLCDSIDFSELESTYNMKPDQEPTQSATNSGSTEIYTCSGYLGSLLDDEFVYFEFKASVYSDDTEASSMQSSREDELSHCDKSDKADDGPWDSGMTASDPDGKTCYLGIDEENTGLAAISGNVVIDLRLGSAKEFYDGSEDEMLIGIGEQIMEIAAE